MLMLVQVYGDSAMKKTAIYKWVKRFSEESKPNGVIGIFL